MPSSTSSSEFPDHGMVERAAPDRPWLTLAVVSLLGGGVAVAAWEARARDLGYTPTYSDTPNLWSERRALARGVGPEQVVLIGASRILFDTNLETFRAEVGGPLPIQLATVGSNPLVILEDLAKDPTYAGTTIVGIAPGLAAAAAGPPIAFPTRYVTHHASWSPAQRFELPLALWLQDRFALINPDLTLSNVVKGALGLSPRKDAYAPEFPPHMYTLDRTRQARMTVQVATDPAKQHEIQQIWLPLFKGPPKPAAFTEEQWAKMQADGWDANRARFRAAVAAITARGGRVILHRFPATGEVYELERKLMPNVLFWDRLVADTGAPAISWEDYPELQGFPCPEWSHLNAEDAIEYTRRLIRVLRREGLL